MIKREAASGRGAKNHCDKLAPLDEDEAKEFDAMANMHRGLAK
jgi:hypothetical protein